MATTLKLTWDKSTKRWCKVYKSQKLYLGNGKRKDDAKSYQLALEEFDRRKVEIDEQTAASKPHYGEYKRAIELRREMLAWLTEERPQWPVHDQSAAAAAAILNGRWQEHDGVRAERLLNSTDPSEREQGMADFTRLRVSGDEAGWTAPYHNRMTGEPILIRIPTCAVEFNAITKEVEQLNRIMARPKPPALDEPGTLFVDPLHFKTDWEREQWEGRVESLRTFRRWTAAASHADTIEANIDIWLQRKQIQAFAGELSRATVTGLDANIKHLRTFAGSLAVQQLNGKTLEGFHADLLRKVEAGNIARDTAKNILAAAKAFINWLWETEVMETLPRNLKKLKITVPAAKVKTLPVDVIKALLAKATDRTRLFLLLMLNCGMTQKDIADLHPAEVDWNIGVIERKRSKTHSAGGVPVVHYKLWPDTFALLKTCRSADSQRVLVNERGGPLVQRGFHEGTTKAHTVDNIKTAYARLYRRQEPKEVKVVVPPPKLLRKTASSMLENHATYGRYSQYFLGHAPRSIAERHYVQPSEALFDEAIAWLGQQFGLVTVQVNSGTSAA